jgi:hypothetical protein
MCTGPNRSQCPLADELPDDVYYLVLKDAEGNETKLARTGAQAMALAAGEGGGRVVAQLTTRLDGGR